MILYDELIKKFQKEIMPQAVELDLSNSDWPWDSERSMILRSDMAYELGGENCYAIGTTIVTADKKLIDGNKVFLVGNNIHKINKDTSYARVAIVRVKEEAMGEGNELYDAIRRLEYTRYHFYPKGFMMRVSSALQKESVRISKNAIEEGLDFEKTGRMMQEAFFDNPMVEAVWIYYITDESFDYKLVQNLAKEANDITSTIDHILKNINMDCSTCSLQKICDEVEGLRELHFKQSN